MKNMQNTTTLYFSIQTCRLPVHVKVMETEITEPLKSFDSVMTCLVKGKISVKGPRSIKY